MIDFLVPARYIALKRRHALEMEGFQNEIQQLKTTLKHVQRLANSNEPHSSQQT